MRLKKSDLLPPKIFFKIFQYTYTNHTSFIKVSLTLTQYTNHTTIKNTLQQCHT